LKFRQILPNESVRPVLTVGKSPLSDENEGLPGCLRRQSPIAAYPPNFTQCLQRRFESSVSQGEDIGWQ
jgi:hypothetical protein